MASRVTSQGALSITQLFLSLLLLIPLGLADNITSVLYKGHKLPVNQQPSLWTEDYADCLGGSLFDVSRFDAALYQDNMTVTFHMQGTSTVSDLEVMMYIGVYAYGELRFAKIFDPCAANINRLAKLVHNGGYILIPSYSMCPTNTSIPVEVSGLIPLSESDIENIPTLAYSVPDFERQAMLRIFSNLTTSEIACYSAMVTNGNTMSHPAAVGGILGVIVFCALLASFTSATFGNDIPTIRTHYAHSMSIFVVFAVLHHIFFTGGKYIFPPGSLSLTPLSALSMNWPSVLPSFWSNFAWSAGMIYLPSMQMSINRLIGNNFGNTSAAGAAGLGASDSTGGGYRISEIYRRAFARSSGPLLRDPGLISDVIGDSEMLGNSMFLIGRNLENDSTGFYWYGSESEPGLPIPGNFSGLAGTLSFEQIPASNAFLTGFIWLLILLAAVVCALVLLKWVLELLSTINVVRSDRLELFRRYWVGLTAMAVTRTCFIAFFMTMFFSLF